MWNFQDLEESGGLGDHVGQALGGRQVLAQVPLVWASQAGFPPAGGTEKQVIQPGFPPVFRLQELRKLPLLSGLR